MHEVPRDGQSKEVAARGRETMSGRDMDYDNDRVRLANSVEGVADLFLSGGIVLKDWVKKQGRNP